MKALFVSLYPIDPTSTARQKQHQDNAAHGLQRVANDGRVADEFSTPGGSAKIRLSIPVTETGGFTAPY